MYDYQSEQEEKVCDNCLNSQLVRLDSGALELKCSEKNEGVCSFGKCSKWESRLPY